ncbi:MAG TPA: hypothetical protein DDY70_01110 [Clostridiales bacterium]|nr:hypothetical protein [Clostridiales bacterium]
MQKRRISFLILLFLTMFCLFSCAGQRDTHTVTFLSDTGEVIAARECADGGRVTFPDAPEKDLRIFLGWCSEGSEIPRDPTAPVRSDLTLTARYVTDYAAWTNRIAKEVISANLTVETRYYRTPYAYDTSIGSGVLIATEGDTCFLLTKCHTVKKSGYLRAEHAVIDCYGNRYTATLNSADEAYDLAVLFFTKWEKELATLKLAAQNPACDVAVAAVGQPGGQRNTLTYGKTQSYRTLTAKDGEESFVDFDVLLHTAPTDHGSSGGALLNENLEIVGLDFAVLQDENGEFLSTAAIPAEKIAAYLAAHPFY